MKSTPGAAKAGARATVAVKVSPIAQAEFARTVDSARIASEELDVTINAHGAEVVSVRHRILGEMLWQAEPIWPSHAPILFPIVGQLAGDRLHVDGRSYPLRRHGFARDRRFDWLDRTATACRLVLRDDAETRARYPFAFELEIGYQVRAATLDVNFIIRNTGARTLPASAGAHPAFRWPLVDGAAKNVHTLEFERPEPAPIRRLQDGLLKRERFPSPIDGGSLRLDEQLFAADALILDELASRWTRYSGPGLPAITVAWTGFVQLGIWSKADADFVCIEPWYGYASPVDFDGPVEQKPGLMLIPPGGTQVLTLSIAIDPAGVGLR